MAWVHEHRDTGVSVTVRQEEHAPPCPTCGFTPTSLMSQAWMAGQAAVARICRGEYARSKAEAAKRGRKRVDYRVPAEADFLVEMLGRLDKPDVAEALMASLHQYDVQKAILRVAR